MARVRNIQHLQLFLCPAQDLEKQQLKKKKKMSKSAKYSALTALLQFIYALIH